MKKLPFIIFALLLIGCSDNGVGVEPEPEFQPYIIGNFKVVSPIEAKFIGENNNQQTMSALGDTVHIKQPGDQYLSLWRDSLSTESAFYMQFIDSTLSEPPENASDVTLPEFEFPKGPDGPPIKESATLMSFSEERMMSKFSLNYYCGYEFSSPNPIFLIKYYREDGSMYKTYAIHAKGIEQTLMDIVCH